MSLGVAISTRRTDAIRFLSRLQAELEVQHFERERDRLRAQHASAERARHCSKIVAGLSAGVISIDAEVTRVQEKDQE